MKKKRNFRRIAQGLAAVFLVLGLASQGIQAARTDAKATKGKEIYTSNCSSCHRAKGKSIRKKSLHDFIEAVKQGEEGMPDFPNLSTADIKAIKYYLRYPKRAGTTEYPAEPTYTNAIKSILDTYCVSCHGGANPSGGIDLSTYQDAYAVRDAVKSAVDTGTMPPSGSIPVKAITAIDTWVTNGALE